MISLSLDERTDPIELFSRWLKDAETTEPNDPNAVALATATPEGVPSVRMVLMKHADARGFAFYTNAESKKGVQIASNPYAEMCFHWKSLRRQVRISGLVAELLPSDADAYFHSRSRLSQLGAVASQQSRPLASRDALEERIRELEIEFPVRVPRPEYWKGYVLQPERVEFWMDGAGRLHDRYLFIRQDERWLVERLYP